MGRPARLEQVAQADLYNLPTGIELSKLLMGRLFIGDPDWELIYRFRVSPLPPRFTEKVFIIEGMVGNLKDGWVLWINTIIRHLSPTSSALPNDGQGPIRSICHRTKGPAVRRLHNLYLQDQ